MVSMQLYLYYRPEIEISIFLFIDYVYFRWWGISFIFFAIGARYDKIKTESKYLAPLIVSMSFFAIIFLWRITLFNAANEFDEAGFFKDICFQSTGYTCSPASCALLLKKFGINAGEREMSELCLTQITGTEYINIARGLKIKLDPFEYEVKLTRASWETLNDITLPCITSIYILNGILHTITILKINDNEVTFADPLAGKLIIYKKEKFIESWDNIIIHVKKL